MTLQRIRTTSRPGRRLMPIAAGVAALAATVVIGVGVAATDRDSDTAASTRSGPMGGAVIDTAGEATGTATAGGVTVEGADVALGRVPLNVTVEPTWNLRNSSEQRVVLGQPHAEVVEGCCPGPLDLRATSLAPGEETTLVFPLQMHPGMDGPHDFAVHVPVTAADRTDLLILAVTGDFRD